MGHLKGKRALVTGATSGIGLATARRLLQEEARVAVTGNDVARMDAARGMLPGALVVRSDAGNIGEQAHLAEQLREAYGELDAVIVNAGTGIFAPVEQFDEAQFDRQMAINFKGPYFLLAALSPLLARGASVILVSSIGAYIGQPQSSVYAASKGALTAAGRAVAAEWVGRGIRVNVLSPGPTRTPIHDKLGADADAILRDVRARVPMGRLAEPDEVAEAIVFLAGDGSRFMTGSEVIVDGGTLRLWS